MGGLQENPLFFKGGGSQKGRGTLHQANNFETGEKDGRGGTGGVKKGEERLGPKDDLTWKGKN